MAWMKVRAAADFCGGISEKTLYAAVRRGQLKAARIGAGRNLLFSDVYLTEWLERSSVRTAVNGDFVVPLRRRA